MKTDRLVLTRRAALLSGAALLATPALPPLAFAQDAGWKPERTVEVVVGVGPGGANDRTARDVERFLKNGGFTPAGSIVTNRPGGGHSVALAYTLTKDGDPHVLQVVGGVMLSNNILGRSPISYTQFTPIVTLFDEQMVFAVGANSSIKSAEDLVAKLKQDPSSISFSISTGIGTTNHISVLLLAKQLGLDTKAIKAVSFNSSTEGVTATIGGHIDVVVTTPFALNPFVESGDLRYIAAASEERSGGLLAEVPTWRELGHDIVVAAWRLVVAPPNLTEAQIAYWDNAFTNVADTDEWKAMLEKEALVSRRLSSAETRTHLDNEDKRYRELLASVSQ
ncbi:putative tricarboxylic transport membrane protein [Aureimonas altamirensis DSM 21988]|uniref:Tricarboxylic transport membrane protein n=1 Tax=Aureimonas altamirensis DSM 21988 TaxID=1121026 RepID=A0ABY1IPL1_9HYPH|nr:tripartite tricarboxylate transporter substrate binding protein [Aureimonas altamirensis]SHJ78694.1 putative tricarboxylic transport membrane protein [Aureimonas altamirensis DSM 21988]